MIKIAIIGGGPGGVSLCMQLKKQLIGASLQEHVEIMVFEKNSSIGLGIPYFAQEDCHILNIPKEQMDPMPGETNNFAQWHAEAFDDANQTSFPPRHHFGAFLESMAIRTQHEGKLKGLKISYLTENKVFDIQEGAKGIFKIKAAHGDYVVNYVILSTGHMPTTSYIEFVGHKGYIHDPWNMHDYEQIKPNETVSILGTRLTAIDAALKLKHMNHKGTIIMASRSGLLPTVLGNKIPSYRLKHITLKALHELKYLNGQHVKLSDLAILFWKEFNEAADNKEHLYRLPTSYKDISPLDWINNEILEAELGASALQKVLFALYPLMTVIWPMLNKIDQAYFLEHYNSLFNNYLAAFPLENAYKIKEMLSSGFIEICGGLTKVEYLDKKFNLHVDNNEIRTSNVLINASGPGYDATRVELLANMLEQALIARHCFGGIKVDKNTFQVIGRDNKANSHFFAIGELTKGECFLVTKFSITVEQASMVTSNLINQLVGGKVGVQA